MIPLERHIAGDVLTADRTLECDVAVIGTGAGGAVAAETLSQAGLAVVMIEEGPLRSREHFRMREGQAYAELYQDLANRATKSGSVRIMQGRTVGGSTVVNWTASFRTPSPTLQYWRDQFGLADYTEEAMASWFDKIQRELAIQKWHLPPNGNNAVLWRGAEKLGWTVAVMDRNVKGCADIGYCGMGCPLDAKQSMLVTKVPAAMKHGAWLVSRARAERFAHAGTAVTALACVALKPGGYEASGPRLTVRARHYVVAGGGINSPGLLLRSRLPDPHRRIGARTFLHPVSGSIAEMPERVDPWAGAVQSVYSDQFLWPDGASGPMGYKLEVAPLHPIFYMANNYLQGEALAAHAARLPHANWTFALSRDGFHEQSAGGTVELREDGSAVLDYPVTDYVWDGLRRGVLSTVECQFAAGAKQVLPNHVDARRCSSWDEARALIGELPMAEYRMRIGSAHVMGGCGMGADPRTSVVNGRGKFHHMDNLHVMDGSVFPTSIGANPQWSIYATVARMADGLAAQLTGKAGSRAPAPSA